MKTASQVVETLFEAMRRKNLAEAPLATDIEYEGPMMAELRGSDKVSRFLGGYLNAVQDLQIVRQIAGDEYVATELSVDTVFAKFQMVYIARVRDERIIELRSYYDPRPFMQGMGGEDR